MVMTNDSIGHPWIRNTTNEVKVPLDISILRLMKAYMRSSTLRKAALRVRFYFSFYEWRELLFWFLIFE